MTQDHRHSHAAPSDLPYWASHKIVIYDRFLMAGRQDKKIWETGPQRTFRVRDVVMVR